MRENKWGMQFISFLIAVLVIGQRKISKKVCILFWLKRFAYIRNSYFSNTDVYRVF